MVDVLHSHTMATTPKADRGDTATETLTLRLTHEDRTLLDKLVAVRAAELADDGTTVTAASYVRGLIRRDARAKGLLTDAPAAEAPLRPTEGSAKSLSKASPAPTADAVRAALQRAIDANESQQGIARSAGIDPGHLSRFKGGKGGLSSEALRKLATVLKLV